jgi:dihydrolipoamide dehydrogenase
LNKAKVAVLEGGKMGGTCINVGCIPSKMLIYPADVLSTIRETEKLGIKTTAYKIDFKNIMDRMQALVDHDTSHQTTAVEATPEITLFKEKGEFIADYTMQVGTHTIKGKTIFIASGTRTLIPPIKGIENVDYLTSDTVLQLKSQPKSIIIAGGGYIGMEYSHFFSSIGTKTTVIQREDRVIPNEEPEVANLLKNELGKFVDIYTGFDAVEVTQNGSKKTLVVRNRTDGIQREFTAEALMIATGRISNADMLKPEKTGVKLDSRGFIEVNEFLQTNKPDIYAFGDAIGRQMFRHAANYEAGVVWHNANHKHKVPMDFTATPHAVFTHPQIAAVGLKEEEAKQRYKILVGKAFYRDTAMGAAMGNPEGFVKVIVEQETGKILGGHIIGPEAAVIIQEITNAMASGNGDYSPIARGMHIHPALNEVIQNAFGALQQTEQEHG